MIEIRGRDELGRGRIHGLEAVHHFSFGRYQEWTRNGWGALRVLNHNLLAPRTELRPEPVDGVDIVSIVRKGAIAHSGSLGRSARTVAGEVQLICPGTGIVHADTNPGARAAEFVEIRIAMDRVPERAHRRTVAFPNRATTGHLTLLASGFLEDRLAMPLNAEARIYGARMPASGAIDYALTPGRLAYAVSLKGAIEVNGRPFGLLEGAAIADEEIVRFRSHKFAELLLLDIR